MATPDNRFSKNARLTQRGEFDRVFATPDQRSSDRYFIVLGRFCGEERARLGIIVAKRHIARAHERNRVKRVVRESFRQYRFKKLLDLVVLARASAQTATNDELQRSLARHWKHIQS